MSKRKSYVGKQFNKLLIIKDIEDRITLRGQKIRMVRCVCACGLVKDVRLNDLKRGRIISCGCHKSSLAKERLLDHSLSSHKLYKVWQDMKSRCCRLKDCSYKDYGGRGIKVCDEWLNDFMNFYNWCMDNGWKEGLQIDRIDNDGNYEPDNCRFVTPMKNTINQRLKKTNKSGYKDIYYKKEINKWLARIAVNYKRIHIGVYLTLKEAVEARNEYIINNNLDRCRIQKYKEVS